MVPLRFVLLNSQLARQTLYNMLGNTNDMEDSFQLGKLSNIGKRSNKLYALKD